ncbi:MAG: ChbG/HpnK family deacetylase [Candidatus Omnitrophica bacterium]|nr:ChbG/HpnK family deacetylase [Candidatus Omnitrophota bacterium]
MPQEERKKRFIISADDFGLHESINESIEIGYCKGVITNASLVACGDSFDHAVKIAARNRGLGVGIHLTLVGERPLADPKKIKTIVGKDGMLFRSHMELFSKICAGLIDMEHIAIECEEQLTRVVESGILPTHVDSHQHIHALRPVFKAIKPVLNKFGITRIRGLNIPWFDFSFEDLKKVAFSVFVMASCPFRKSGFRTPDFLVGFFKSGKIGPEYLIRVIEKIKPGITEINVHPGVDNKVIKKKYGHLKKLAGWPCDWEREHASLLSPLVKDAIATSGISLVNYKAV